MSSAEMSRFITSALDDVRVRDRLKEHPDQAFLGYDLSSDEQDAIKAADEARLKDLGIDPMTARSFMAFHDIGKFAPDRPDTPSDN